MPRAIAAVVAIAAAFALTASSCQPPPPAGGGTTTTTEGTSSTVPDDSTDSIDIGGETVTVQVPAGRTVSVDPAEPNGLPPTANGFDAPLGALDITVGGLANGAATQVVVTFERSVDLVQKLIDGSWQNFDHDGTTGATLAADGRSVTLDLVDGGRGDTDGAANGTIVDPLLPLDADGLQITTSATPFVEANVPYSLQLDTVGGEADAEVTWTVLDGAVPEGMSLDPFGVVAGTSAGAMVAQHPVAVRVQATDGTTTDTKLLLFSTIGANDTTTTGSPLPEGAAIDVVQRTSYLDAADVLQSSGTLDHAQHMDVATLARVGTRVNPAGTLMAHRWQVDLNQPVGQMLVIDTDSGATVASLGGAYSSPPIEARWSPDGSYLVLPDYWTNFAITGALYETTGWTLVREFDQFGRGELRWSDDGSKLFDTGGLGMTSGDTTTEIHTLEAPDFTSGPTVTIASPTCTARAISVTDRLAVTCPGGFGTLLTMSAQDGSDIRNVFAGCSSPLVLPCKLLPQNARFSPSGEHLVFVSQEVHTTSPVTGYLVAATVPDEDGAASTNHLAAPVTGALNVLRWR